MRAVVRYAPVAWATALAVLLLGPALGRGYVLTYDMVWVPDLAMRADFLGWGTALPRAVPSDAVVAALNLVVPGMVLQKLVLVGLLVGAGLGGTRLVGPGLAPRMVAVALLIWNPYVVERLWLGQWTVLVGYAALPWLASLAVRARREGRVPPLVLVVLPMACLSASAGLMAAVVVLALGVSRDRRTSLLLLAATVAANSPWLVAGLLHAPTADSTAATRFFGLHGDGMPAPLAALSLGGIWNRDVVPGTRLDVLLPLLALVGIALAVAMGWRRCRDRLGWRTLSGLLGCWLVGYVVALLSWLTPSALDWWAETVPGGGLVRDGSRFLALCVPLLVALAGDATDAVVAWADRRVPDGALGIQLAIVAAVVPLVLLPDAGYGITGHLRAVSYPDDWASARVVLADHPEEGDLLVLPFSSYRAPEWNHGNTVIDPLGRYLQPDYLVNDQLSVSGQLLSGEDPRVPQALAALALPDPQARARALGELGVGVVAVEKDAPGEVAEPSGTTIHDGATLRLIRIDDPVAERDRSAGWFLALGAAWAAYVGLFLAGAGRAVTSVTRIRPRGGSG